MVNKWIQVSSHDSWLRSLSERLDCRRKRKVVPRRDVWHDDDGSVHEDGLHHVPPTCTPGHHQQDTQANVRGRFVTSAVFVVVVVFSIDAVAFQNKCWLNWLDCWIVRLNCLLHNKIGKFQYDVLYFLHSKHCIQTEIFWTPNLQTNSSEDLNPKCIISHLTDVVHNISSSVKYVPTWVLSFVERPLLLNCHRFSREVLLLMPDAYALLK